MSNTEFEGGDDGHGPSEGTFLVKQAQPSHIYTVTFLAYGNFEILGKCPKTPKTTCFLGAFNGFLAGEPRLGCRKADFRFLSG